MKLNEYYKLRQWLRLHKRAARRHNKLSLAWNRHKITVSAYEIAARRKVLAMLSGGFTY